MPDRRYMDVSFSPLDDPEISYGGEVQRMPSAVVRNSRIGGLIGAAALGLLAAKGRSSLRTQGVVPHPLFAALVGGGSGAAAGASLGLISSGGRPDVVRRHYGGATDEEIIDALAVHEGILRPSGFERRHGYALGEVKVSSWTLAGRLFRHLDIIEGHDDS